MEGGGAAGGEGHASNPRATVHSVAAPTDAAPTDAARPTGGTQVTLELQLDNERNRLARFELTLNMAGLCIGTRVRVRVRVWVRVHRYERGAPYPAPAPKPRPYRSPAPPGQV